MFEYLGLYFGDVGVSYTSGEATVMYLAGILSGLIFGFVIGHVVGVKRTELRDADFDKNMKELKELRSMRSKFSWVDDVLEVQGR